MPDNKLVNQAATWADILFGQGPPLYGDTMTRRIPTQPENMFRYYRPMAAPNADQNMLREMGNDPRFRMQTQPSWLDPPDIPEGLGGVYPGIGGRGMALMMPASPPTAPLGATPGAAAGLTNTPLGFTRSATTPTSVPDWLAIYLSGTNRP